MVKRQMKTSVLLKYVKVRRFIAFLLLSLMFVSFSAYFVKTEAKPTSFDGIDDLLVFEGNYDWETNLNVPTSSSNTMTYTEYRTSYCILASTPSECASAANGKKIRFDTAEELYRFSVDVSLEQVYQSQTPSENVKLSSEKIAVLLSLDYVLGRNIDYAVMGAKTFIPIGYWFSDVQATEFQNIFTGSFDGQGFTITNLYVAGYDYLIFQDDIDEFNTIDIALSSYYSMFPFNAGTITNFGLINPTFELLNLHIDINKVSNIVGMNLSTGNVNHVYVIDTRTDVTEAGIRYKVGTSSEVFQAAGLVHTNQGIFTDAYYVSKVVVNGNYINKFNIQPVLYLNSGTISNLVYDSTVYLLSVTVGSSTFTVDTPSSNQTGETTTLLKSSSSSLNTANDLWHFYQLDTYPILQGLVYENGYYLISSPIDLQFFSRLISFTTIENGLSYAYSAYKLTTDIDMSELSPIVYKTPGVTFYGEFDATNPNRTDLSDNYYIYNLNIQTGTIRGTSYYAGLFSILGTGAYVHDLNMTSSTISLTNTGLYYSYQFYVGGICGRLSGGTIEDVMVDFDITMGTQAIGESHVGGIAGLASGLVQRVSSRGDVSMGTHSFLSTYSITPNYYVGGIIGSALLSQLVLKDVVNHGNVTGFGTSSTFLFATGYTSISSKVGGVIGYLTNTSSAIHQLINVSNKGNLYLNAIINTAMIPSTQRVGGVFGEIKGLKPILELNGSILFGNLYNQGNIYATYQFETATIRAAGIGISSLDEVGEFALLFNHGSFGYDTTGANPSNPLFRYTGTIYDLSSTAGITLSRAYNYGDFLCNSAYYANISPLYRSENNNPSLIRYSANYGDILFLSNGGSTQITLQSDVTISGITSSSNSNFLNVLNAGNIHVVNVNCQTYSIYLSGITKTLASGKRVKNTINEGNLTIAEISGSGNLYVGGIVVSNLSGDLQDPSQSSTHPEATIGIINTLNVGEISSSYGIESQGLYGIHGTSNTFAGGIAALNAGSIQDAANLANIKIWNSDTTYTSTFFTDSSYAGLVDTFKSGVVIGGIVAATLSGNARVYDTGNNGNLVAKSNQFARAGGVLGVSLYAEADAGGITAGMGLVDNIETSVLSNGFNFGNISTLTNVIGQYSTTSTSQSFSIYYDNGSTTTTTYSTTTTVGSQDRPPIYASSGGVIGYGLCVMKRMLNHGTIASTDVAGGIVGATYALGNVTTISYINTAINYGDIKAFPVQSVNAINLFNLDYIDISTYFYADGNTFIFPSGYTVEEPRGKRGFGGIFGRLQRGLSGIMTSEGGEFDFIVNANPNIDLIGRLDQVYNFSSSSRFFRFNNAIYYSAKVNDTTQVVFTGFLLYNQVVSNVTGARYNWTYTFTTTYYRQVGIVRSVDSTEVTQQLDTSSRSAIYSIGQTTISLRYYNRINVPWITENPNDPLITNAADEYMYDSNFPMRTDSSLQEYIYYMDYDLLASRFQSGGENPRLNGMYVLSTTAGSTYGAVLPANIDTSKIGLINEDYIEPISLLTDYDSISILYRQPLSESVLTKYENLRQTIFNEKSEIIPTSTNPISILDQNGSNAFLTNATVDFDNRIVTFKVSMEAFDISQTIANFQIANAFTSLNALVGLRPDDYYNGTPTPTELLDYRDLLYPDRELSISTNYPASLQVTLPSKTITSNVTLSVGYFTVFSEAFLGDDLFNSSNYYTSYEVRITFTPGVDSIPTGSIGIASVQFNGGSSLTVTNQTDVRSLGDVTYNGSITFIFEDTKGILTEGYDFQQYFVLKYSDSSIVPSSYYTVSTVPTVINTLTNPDTGTYIITFTFSEALRMGDYTFEYRYFSSSSVQSVVFDKAASSNKEIIDLNYYSELNSTVINGLNITSSINLGSDVVISTLSNNYTETVLTGIDTFLSNYTYDLSYLYQGSFLISPFAKVTSARLVSKNYQSGYITYEIEIIIQAEDLTYATYQHFITEREIQLNAVLTDGNDTFINDIYAIREAENTVFSIDMGLDQTLNLYSVTEGIYNYFEVSVSATSLDGLTTFTPEQIVGLTYEAIDYLYIHMNYSTIPGIYTFTLTYWRDGTANAIVFSDLFQITKKAGTSAYLTDIRFSDLANETSYPTIRITDELGVINESTGLDPRVYFGGIDYDDANTIGYTYFRVDGQVSNTPLNYYVPFMVDYLPYGGSISRYAYDALTQSFGWTNEVNQSSTLQERSVLVTDYTVMPETGLEPTAGEEVIIQYRVTSEDGNHFTYYFVTVADVTYNVTLLFDIYYCTSVDNSNCQLASESQAFSNQLVIINVKNMITDGDDSVIGVEDPAFYPNFTEVTGLYNQMTEFYFTYSGDYRYSFGRNRAGFFAIEIELPQDQYLHNLYTYEIEVLDYQLNDASNYVAGLKGKYYYIEYATKNRSRRFNVYIRENQQNSTSPWGLFDFFRTWGDISNG